MRIDRILSEPSLGQERGGRFFICFNLFNVSIQCMPIFIHFHSFSSRRIKTIKKDDHHLCSFWGPFSIHFYWFSDGFEFRQVFRKPVMRSETLQKQYKLFKNRAQNPSKRWSFFNSLICLTENEWKSTNMMILQLKQLNKLKTQKNDTPFPGPGWSQIQCDQFESTWIQPLSSLELYSSLSDWLSIKNQSNNCVYSSRLDLYQFW